MKTILRDKIVKEVAYISDDGVEFKNIHDCENHEMRVDKASTDIGKTRLIMIRKVMRGNEVVDNF